MGAALVFEADVVAEFRLKLPGREDGQQTDRQSNQQRHTERQLDSQ